MSTGETWLNITPNMVFNFAVLQPEFVEPMREALRQSQVDLWGAGGTLGTVKALLNYAATDKLTLAAKREGWTGKGQRLVIDPAEAAWTDVPFANSGATTYYAGARYNEVPDGGVLAADGAPEFSKWVEAVGEHGAPDSVADLGGSLKMVIDTIVAPVWTVAALTRPVTVWKVDPATSSSEIVWTGTCVLDGGQIVLTVPHVFGQSSPSTTPADYLVHVHGPTITTVDISANTDYWYLGTVISTVHATTAQVLITPFGSLVTAFGVQHDVGTGVHTDVTADSVEVDGTTGTGFMRIDSSGTKVVEIDDSGTGPSGAVTFRSSNARGNINLDDAGDAELRVSNVGAGTRVDLLLEGTYTADLGTGASIGADHGADQDLDLENRGAGDLHVVLHGPGNVRRTDARNYLAAIPAHCFGSPTAGGATYLDGVANAPNKVQSSSSTALVEWLIPVDTIMRNASGNDGSADLRTVLNGINLYSKRTDASSSIKVELHRMPRNSTSASSIVGGAAGTFTGTTSGSTWELETNGLGGGRILDEADIHYLRIEIDPVSAVGDTELGYIELDIDYKLIA